MSENVDQNLLKCIELRFDVFNEYDARLTMSDCISRGGFGQAALHCTITSRRLFEEVEGRLS